ncbi:MAG TPA: cytochrome c [Bryobacteraceae bacterium]|jgi:mono/diheme cytochrome c family protein
MSRLSLVLVLAAAAAFPLMLSAQGSAQGSAQAAGNAENGKRLFLRDGCFECHGYAGQGGAAGARIASTVLNVQGVIRYVRRPSGAMPAYTDKVLSDQELTDIYAYLKTMPLKAAKDIPLLNQLRGQ